MFSLKIFKRPSASRFHYTPRYYKGVEGENVYKFKSKYRKDEIEMNYNDFKSQWAADRKVMRTRGNFEINRRLIYIIAALILIFLFLMDFDLSFFRKH